jgi:serine/threonine-protein phosphatase 6 regulatory subunit 3
MFWSSAVTSSNIDEVLNDPTVTLNTVLEQEEILQELRAMNKKLVEFLSRPESLNGMIDLITTEPSTDVPLASQYKLPNVACEVLTSDNSFVEKVTGDKIYLEKMFFFFRDKPTPINPLLSSYVCRVLSEIISRKLDQNWYSYQLNLIQIMGYLQAESGVLSWLLNHLDCSAVCEFFFKLMLNVEGQDMRNSLYEWLVDKERIILRIMEKMTRHELEEVHANVSRLIGDLLYAFQDELINGER